MERESPPSNKHREPHMRCFFTVGSRYGFLQLRRSRCLFFTLLVTVFRRRKKKLLLKEEKPVHDGDFRWRDTPERPCKGYTLPPPV